MCCMEVRVFLVRLYCTPRVCSKYCTTHAKAPFHITVMFLSAIEAIFASYTILFSRWRRPLGLQIWPHVMGQGDSAGPRPRERVLLAFSQAAIAFRNTVSKQRPFLNVILALRTMSWTICCMKFECDHY
jgi:hypothetical protein